MTGEIKRLTGKNITREILEDAWSRLEVTYDPLKNSLMTSAQWAYELGLLDMNKPDLKEIYDLRLLNDILKEKRLKPLL